MRAPMMLPWWIAQAVRAAAAPAVFALNVQAAYWQTWHEVFREVL